MGLDATVASDGFEVLCAKTAELADLRTSIRDFLSKDRAQYRWTPTVDCWLSSWDEQFSARLGDEGFLGMTIPGSYGGRGASHLHRYVVTEELLAHGAPVAAHWMADRQIAPALLAYGSERQRADLLPQIAAGRLYFAIGLSEHGAGSDLAAVRSKATKTEHGWLINGTKVWTSGAHRAHLVVVLARTSSLDPEHRHAGLSQFVIPLDRHGITISPVEMMSGEHHFNEVLFDNVFVPDEDVLGEIGAGWHQVTSELSFERSGPERFLSTFPLIAAAVRVLAEASAERDAATASTVGHLMSQVVSLRQMSISVAHTLTAGGDAATQAALVKDLGTRFEQNSVDIVGGLLERADVPTFVEPALSEKMDHAILHRPLFTLRGGTNEILRGVVARAIGLR